MILRLNKVMLRLFRRKGRNYPKIFYLKPGHWSQLYDELRELARKKNDLPVSANSGIMNLMFMGIEIRVR